MEPFVFGLQKSAISHQTLRAVCVGYVTKERSGLKQFFTRRAIILGGPVLSDDCSDAEVTTLLEAVKTKTRHPQSLDSDLPETTPQSSYMHASRQSEDLSRVAGEQPDASQKHAALTKNTQNRLRNLSPIYIETRNFNDYGKWREAFEVAGFSYSKHLNFHVDCRDEKAMWERLSENRRRQLRRSDAEIIIIDGKTKTRHLQSLDSDLPETTPQSACMQASRQSDDLSRVAGEQQDASQKHASLTKNTKNIEDILEWYGILERLYRTKVKTPLWPVEFFLGAYRQGIGKFLLVKYGEKVIGGSMIVTDGKCVYEWFECGMNAEYKEQYPSVMATWAGIQWAKEHGCARYDMMGAGEPGVPYGVRDFKSEFGGTMVEHGRFVCVCKPWLYKIGQFGVKVLKRLK